MAYPQQPYGQQPDHPQHYVTSPHQAYGHPPGPPRRRKSSGGVILLAVLACVVVLFGGCAVLIATLGSGTKPTPVTEAETKAKEAESAQKVAGIGAVVKDGKFSFKVTKLERRASVGGSFLNKQAQGVFLLVYVTVENIGDEAQAFSGAAQKLYDGSDREYEASSEAAIYFEESQSLYENINPGNAVKGVVLFDIPKNTKYKTIELHDSVFSDGVRVSLT